MLASAGGIAASPLGAGTAPPSVAPPSVAPPSVAPPLSADPLSLIVTPASLDLKTLLAAPMSSGCELMRYLATPVHVFPWIPAIARF